MSAPTITFRHWMLEQFELLELRDIAEHGAEAGWSGFTYYSETSELYDWFEDELWKMLECDANAQGHDHPLELVASFRGAANVSNDATFKNLIVWYAAERTAFELADRDRE